MSKINKVFAIQCYGPSGTTLLHSLMDQHPEILSMPLLFPIPIYYLWDEYLDGKDKTPEKNLHSEIQVVIKNKEYLSKMGLYQYYLYLLNKLVLSHI